MAKRPVEKIDFRPYGAAIKLARKGHKESRNKVGDEMYLSPRYLANIENKGAASERPNLFGTHVPLSYFRGPNPFWEYRERKVHRMPSA